MRSFFILLLAILLISSTAHARLEAGLGFSLAWPQSEFKDNVDFAFGCGEAEYLKKGSISRGLGSISYETIQSNTDLLQLRIGLSFGF